MFGEGVSSDQWLPSSLIGDSDNVIQVALDGSQKDGYMSYGGAAALERSWVALSELWTHMLARHGLDYLKMAEAMTFNGQFEGKRSLWGEHAERHRDGVLMEFAQLAQQLEFKTTGFAIHIGGLAEETLRKRKRELFHRAVDDLFQGIPKGTNVALVCDTEQDAADDFRRSWDRMRLDPQSRWNQIVVLAFANSKKIHAMQYADMVTYLHREETERGELTPDKPENPLYTVVVGNSVRTSGHQVKGIPVNIDGA